MFYVGLTAYNKKMNSPYVGWEAFENEMNLYPLTAELKADILSEINYAKDIDADWGGPNKTEDVIDNELRELLPRLCEKYL
jgi:hypothetical protein